MSAYVGLSWLGKTDPTCHRFQVLRRVAAVEPRRDDPLVEEMKRMLLAVPERSHDLMPAPGDPETGLGGEGLGHGDRRARSKSPRHAPGRFVNQRTRGDDEGTC